ncbi:glycosyltransferase involved in cell wall biosynthesis [Bradyrhizobium diazoefficiens]|uniref:Glycosyl transferase n=1 Tax=Bradyrhizobium diazoefficiens TaxID=1355477 RepID=A0A0E4BS31_9BRAD|nr:glycosyltransferase family 4 protein [Bradyrhizobium diazoefficiens]MBR0866014.1 glycosyltransferase family 4 protein [Bradyrhizobium diazoefficiens]MBR0890536.1 glycosyltransferase family 4 protein [Bradyrhizobium diazoefficiens]MBR0922328.1 glycosyltransferase family 4 protein [Bradyrhizobium diazoefficiens]WLA63679.1 glycosyltransferase family 4 protein [Bradyrhizobium diazoefficiens]BAR59371.1 glycosyl transferase [Bradyrhizobium diazoefficiens]
MKILITSSLYPTPLAPKVVGGAETFVRRLAETLVGQNDSVEVIRAASTPNQQMETCNGIDVHSAAVHNIYFPFAKQHSAPVRGIWHAIEDWQQMSELVAARIKAFKPDILHSNNLSGLTTAVWRTAAELGIPVLHTLHDYYLTCPRCSRFSDGHACEASCMSCQILTFRRRGATRHLDAVVGVSQRILDIHTGLGLFTQTPLKIVIRNASTADVGSEETAMLDGTVTFGFIGRLTEEKGIYNLVRAIATIPPERIRLVIAGHASESQRKQIKGLAPNARIEFLGFVQPKEFYEQVNVVVVPSVWEDPSPLVVADAQAACKPLLGTPFGGIQEAIKPGLTGWLTSPDPDSIAKSISAIVEAPQQIVEMSGRLKSGINKWSFDDVVTGYRNVYDQLMRGRGMPRT